MQHLTRMTGGKNYQSLPFDKLCQLARLGEEETDYLQKVEETAWGENNFLLSLTVQKIRRVLGESAESWVDALKAKETDNSAWLDDCENALHELGEEYYQLIDRAVDIIARLLGDEEAEVEVAAEGA